MTISMKEAIFKEPIFIGDIVSCYAKVTNVGNTSITTAVKFVVERLNEGGFLECVPVTTAEVTYLSVDKSGNKKPISAELKRLHGFLN
ncbi:hotdog domain-containing protein [Campylobacter sp.]|uniref:hotdog domain-containing protein n=1 Tax=Campylobacter sp. TaxID=205 RepID=UPI0038B3A1A7